MPFFRPTAAMSGEENDERNKHNESIEINSNLSRLLA